MYSICFFLLSNQYTGGKTKTTIDLANALSKTMNVTLAFLRFGSKKLYKIDDEVNVVKITNTGDSRGTKAYSVYSTNVSNDENLKLVNFIRGLQTKVLYLPNYDSILYQKIQSNLHKNVHLILGEHNGRRLQSFPKIFDDNLGEKRHYITQTMTDRKFFYGLSVCDSLHCISENHFALYSKAHKNAFYIPNVVSLSQDSFKRDGVKKEIVVVGRLSASKNADAAIRGFSKISKNYPDWVLNIVGTGEKEAELRKLVSDLSMNKKIRFLGYVSNINTVFENASICLALSKYESFGLTYVEAMSAGCRVIGANSSIGANLHLSDGRGDLVNWKKQNEIKKVLENTIEDIMSNNSDHVKKIQDAKSYSQSFSAHNISKKWIEQISRIPSKMLSKGHSKKGIVARVLIKIIYGLKFSKFHEDTFRALQRKILQIGL